jgi:hypothetical protein
MIQIIFTCEHIGCKELEIKIAKNPEDDESLFPDKLQCVGIFGEMKILCSDHANEWHQEKINQHQKDHPNEPYVVLS